MASAAKLDDDGANEGGGEYHKPDAKAALKIYREEIAPKNAQIETISGDLSEPYKRIKDKCHFPRSVLDFLIRLDKMEDAKRDHWLLALHSGLGELRLHLPSDLVTMAQGEDGGSVIPFGERSKARLATLPTSAPSDGTETDLADAGDGFDEATEDELAAQEGRPDRAEGSPDDEGHGG